MLNTIKNLFQRGNFSKQSSKKELSDSESVISRVGKEQFKKMVEKGMSVPVFLL